jgi:signal transduction histidine kinase
MNHELRTPLNAVIGFTGLLERERAGPLNVEQARYVGYVKQSGEHTLALVNDVLDLAKIEAGKLDLHPEKLVVIDLLTGVVGMVSASAADKGLQLESEVFDPQLAVIADPLRLRQVVLNLVTNAIKFTQQGGVRIEAGRMGDLGLQITDPVVAEKLSALPDPQSAIVIRVADTGIGIAEEDFPKVFGEFEQIDNPLSRAEEGTGLGLSLVKQLVRLHGGEVWLESEVGGGSTFYVAMPG